MSETDYKIYSEDLDTNLEPHEVTRNGKTLIGRGISAKSFPLPEGGTLHSALQAELLEVQQLKTDFILKKQQTDACLALVVDATPSITLNGLALTSLPQYDNYTEQGATAQDVEDGDISALITISGFVDTGTPGDYTITYSVTDSAGNLATAQRTVTVLANEPPALTLLGTDETFTVWTSSQLPLLLRLGTVTGPGFFELSTLFIEDSTPLANNPVLPSVVFIDDGGAFISPSLLSTGENLLDGDLSTSLSSSDISAWSASGEGIVFSIDPSEEYPSVAIALTGILSGQSFSFEAARASLDWTTVFSSSPSGVTWQSIGGFTYTQANGPTSWTDTLDLSGLVTPTPVYADPGATAVDSFDGELTNSIVVTGSVDLGTVGTYVLTYYVEDLGGLSTTKTRTITITP